MTKLNYTSIEDRQAAAEAEYQKIRKMFTDCPTLAEFRDLMNDPKGEHAMCAIDVPHEGPHGSVFVAGALSGRGMITLYQMIGEAMKEVFSEKMRDEAPVEQLMATPPAGQA